MRKAVIALAGLAVLGWLFWQTVQSSLTEAYAVDAGLASEWNLALRDRPERGAGLLVLEASDQLRAELFQQIFARTMESFMSPVVATVPLVLHAEYRESLGSALSPEDLLQVAEASGLSDTVPAPVCIGVVRGEGRRKHAPALLRALRGARGRPLPRGAGGPVRRGRRDGRVRAGRISAGHAAGRIRRRFRELVAARRQRRHRLPSAACRAVAAPAHRTDARSTFRRRCYCAPDHRRSHRWSRRFKAQ